MELSRRHPRKFSLRETQFIVYCGLIALADTNIAERIARRLAGGHPGKIGELKVLLKNTGGGKTMKDKIESVGSQVFLILLLQKKLIYTVVLKEPDILPSLKAWMLVT